MSNWAHGALRLPSAFFLLLAALGGAAGGAGQGQQPQPWPLPPVIAMGTWPHSLGHNESLVEWAVQQWVLAGGRHIDTAQIYGTEAAVGRAIAKLLAAGTVQREQLFVTTKISGPMGSEAVVRTVLNETLPKLQLRYVDMVLIHFPCLQPPLDVCPGQWRRERADTWSGLKTLVRLGALRRIGVSNYAAEHLDEFVAGDMPPFVNQVEWHLGFRRNDLLEACLRHRVRLQAWSPLGGAGGSSFHPGVPMNDSSLAAVAKKHLVTPQQAALRWSLERGVSVVTASANRAHMAEDLATLNFSLTALDMQILDALSAPSEMMDALIV